MITGFATRRTHIFRTTNWEGECSTLHSTRHHVLEDSNLTRCQVYGIFFCTEKKTVGLNAAVSINVCRKCKY
jgi:hypothetical protein